MAAAGLGNTISDIMGITMATYVEEGCQMLGLKQPRMTPAQFELKSSKRTSSWVSYETLKIKYNKNIYT